MCVDNLHDVRIPGYQKTFEIQPSVGEGPARQRQDRKLGEAIKSAVADDGVIDAHEMDNDIAPLFKDRGAIGKSEAELVNLLDSARDGRKKALIDGVRVRLAPAAKQSFLNHRAGLEAKIAGPAALSEAGFRGAAVASTQTWYRGAVTAAHLDLRNDDPEMFSPAAQDRDLATAGRIHFAEGERPGMYALTSARPEDHEFYADRQFFTRAGDPVPKGQARLHMMAHEPEYRGGQELTSLLAFDRRSGEVLAHLWTTA